MDDEVYLNDEDEIATKEKYILEDPSSYVEEYTQLLSRQFETANARKMLIDTLLRLRHKFAKEWDHSLQRIIEFLQDPDVEVRKFAAHRILRLCTGGKNVGQVANTLAQLVGQGDDASPVAAKSLRTLISEHPKESILAIHEAMNTLDCNCHKLALIKFLDGEVRKLGTIGDGMRKMIYDVLYEILGDETMRHNIRDIKQVFVCAVESSFFPSVVDRIQLVQKAQFDFSIKSNIDVVDMYQTALSLAGWIDEPCEFAQGIVEDFLNFVSESQEEQRSPCSDEEMQEVLKVIVEFTRRRKDFLFLPHNFVVEEASYVNLFNFFLLSCPMEDRTSLLIREQVLMILYNLMPEMPSDYSLLEQKKVWIKDLYVLVNDIKKRSEELKKDLSSKLCLDRAEKQIEQRASLNIGVMAMDFMHPTPKRSHILVPSWLASWKPPRIVPAARIRTDDDILPAKPQPKRRRASSDSPHTYKKKRIAASTEVTFRGRNRGRR